MTVAVRTHQYLRTLSAHLRERAAAMLLSEASDEIERLRLTDEERQAVEWCAEMATVHATDCDEEITTLRGLLKRTK